MSYLLDTQILLWWLGDDRRLARAVRSAIADPNRPVWLSVASVWEMEIKAKLGKLRVPENLEEQLVANGIAVLPIHFRHATALKSLPDLHRDPFDRMLVAQALTEDLTLVTADPVLHGYPCRMVQNG